MAEQWEGSSTALPPGVSTIQTTIDRNTGDLQIRGTDLVINPDTGEVSKRKWVDTSGDKPGPEKLPSNGDSVEEGDTITTQGYIPSGHWVYTTSPQNPVAGKSSCERFVAGLVGATTDTKKFGRVFVGRNLLTAVDLSLRNNEYPTAPVDGFKKHFVDHQGGWARAHIMGVAAAYLVGDSTIVPVVGSQTGYDRANAQFKEDYTQFDAAVAKKDRNLMIEKASEINDDLAGFASGVLLKSYINGGASAEQTHRDIFSIICDH